MKKAALLSILLLAAAGYVWLQTPPASPDLAAMMPGGALLYLQTPDLGRLLSDWDASKVKTDWLASQNFEIFSQSNLFTKLGGVYEEYGQAAGFLPGLRGAMSIAGAESALALYDIRDVEFLYISRVGESQLAQSQLWAARDKFEQRQSGGVTFYLRTDPASDRTVAFAFAKGYLLMATRDDLVARALALAAGGNETSLASDRWYHDAVAAAAAPGDLRLVLNLESLVNSTAFRSYWVQRNASEVRRYWAGVADLHRSAAQYSETRVFLARPEAPPSIDPAAVASVAVLAAVAPPDAGFYKAAPLPNPKAAADFVVRKLIASPPQAAPDWRFAPGAIAQDLRAGTESDLETRIDQPPLPAGAGFADSVEAIRSLLENEHAFAVLQVQSSLSSGGAFLETPAAIVFSAPAAWDSSQVRIALTAAAGGLWTTSGIGDGWTAATIGRHQGERLDGLGTLYFAVRGQLLVLGNNSGLMASVLDRLGTAAPVPALTYAAGFRHSRERANHERLMAALDFAGPGNDYHAPSFFSANIGSLSTVLAGISDVEVTERVQNQNTIQHVIYRLGP